VPTALALKSYSELKSSIVINFKQMKSKSFFIAGIMQGSNTDSGMAEQGYRKEITEIILQCFPDASIIDPLVKQLKRFKTRQKNMLQSAARLDHVEVLCPQKIDPDLQELTRSFHELCDEAANCDVVIAYFPEGEISMGTAVEMYSGWKKRKKVVAISELRQNLTLLACSDVIIPNIKSLKKLLKNGFLFQ
jgi:hypothetical protein